MRNQMRRLTLPELVRVTEISEALFAADTASLPVRFTYTKDTGEVSTRTGIPAGVFSAESKTALYLTDENGENGKTFTLRNITDLQVLL